MLDKEGSQLAEPLHVLYYFTFGAFHGQFDGLENLAVTESADVFCLSSVVGEAIGLMEVERRFVIGSVRSLEAAKIESRW